MNVVLEWLAIIVLPLVAILFGFIPLVFTVSIWKRKQAKAIRQNPLTKHLLRSPAHSLREKIDDIQLDIDAHLSINKDACGESISNLSGPTCRYVVGGACNHTQWQPSGFSCLQSAALVHQTGYSVVIAVFRIAGSLRRR